MDEQIKSVFKCPDLQFERFYTRVLDQFRPLPPRRVVCYFDDQSVCCGPSERGQFVPLDNKNNRICWPDDVRKVLRDEGGNLLDVLIYLPGSTCCIGDAALFVMAFAHELQHFVQWASSPDALNASKKLSLPLGASTWDLPHERDAVIASKRAAAAVIGPDEVAEYTQTQIGVGCPHADYWAFFKCIAPHEQYDWVRETERLSTQKKHTLLG